MKKNGLKILVLMFMCALLYKLQPIQANASSLVYLYEEKQTKTITSGLTYEKKSKLTNLGWIDIYVLKMELTNPNVKMDIIRSSDVWGTKNTLTNIMKENNSVGGINASFFDMATNPSDIIGAEYKNGNYSYLQENYNKTSLGAGSMMVSDSGNVLFSYLSGNIVFRNEENFKGVYISCINGKYDFKNSVVYNRNAMNDTQQIEGKANLYKIVVDNNIVIDVVPPKTAAVIPENGYVVTVNEVNKDKVLPSFNIGSNVNLKITTNFGDQVFNTIISGGGKILKNGVVVQEGLLVQPTSRQPRTAIGVTSDGNYLISMVVDGRGKSIGATHYELGKYLLEYGAYNAIHMDGGGSSTIAARNEVSLGTELLNTPSEGTQRRIVNGLGFQSTAPQGTLTKLKVSAPTQRVFKNSPIRFSVLGFDEYENPVALDLSQLTWSSEGIMGSFNGTEFTPETGGQGTITCYYNGVSGTINLVSADQYIDLDVEPKILYLSQGASGSFSLKGTDLEGYKGVVQSKDAQWSLEDKSLGSFNDGVFISNGKSGSSLVTIQAGDIEIKAAVVVGSTWNAKTSFETEKVSFSAYPETAKGSVEKNSAIVYDGNSSIKLNYSFPISGVTQAAYAVFEGITILDEREGKTALYVYGDNSNLLLKAKLVDAKNNTYNISFTDKIDFNGWKELRAELPKGMTYPVKIERIYIASLKTDKDISGSIYFDKLLVERAIPLSGVDLEKVNFPINDPLYNQRITDYSFKASIVGSTTGSNRLLDTIVKNEYIKRLNKSDLAIFAGNSNINPGALTTKNIIWNNTYRVSNYEDLTVINLGTNSGGIIKTAYSQWMKVQNDLRNTYSNNIIIVGNRNPIKNGSFTDSREAEAFHRILSDFQKMTGKNIYYINASGSSFSADYFEGIRYIDINGINYTPADSKIDLGSSFYLLNFYMSGGKLYYNYESVY